MLKADNKDTRTTLITLVTGGTSKVRIVKSIHAKLSLMLNSFMTEIPIQFNPYNSAALLRTFISFIFGL